MNESEAIGYNDHKTEEARTTMNIFSIKKLIILAVALIISVSSLTTNANALTSQGEWDAAYNKYYSTKTPWQDIDGAANDIKVWFSWQGHYWVRAFVSMAKTFKDPKYMDKAVALIDHMFYYTDEQRQSRGEINVSATPYASAPLNLLLNPSVPSPGWRLWVGGTRNEWRSQTLDDGQITHSILRFVELVKADPVRWAAYNSKADAYLKKCETIVSQHNSLFVFNRTAGIDGSYYYPRPDGTGLYTGAVPLNHSATMGVSLLLLDKIKGGDPLLRDQAAAIWGYYKNSLTLLSNNSYAWLYNPQTGGVQEDFNHGHIDIDFLVLAFERGLAVTSQDMLRFANTYTKNLYKGNGIICWTVDGITSNTTANYWPAGFGWVDLTPFDPTVLDISKEVYSMHYPVPSWGRDMLGWAEILKWSNAPSLTPPKNLRLAN